MKRTEILGVGEKGLVLKRKRPPRIEIPSVLREICVDDLKGLDSGVWISECGFVGVLSLKGKKKIMEDAHKISFSSEGNKGFFGVYDGHGGSKAAEFVAENLHRNIFEIIDNCSENKSKEEAIKEGFLKTDDEFLKQGLSSGVCCVTALIDGSEMVVSNLGDCRAVVCRDGVAEALTFDHKPTREDERNRIQDKGGYVGVHGGTWRVDGTLAVSRSIGDCHLKDWVMAEPETKVVSLTPDTKYLVLASDGLWNEVSNQEAVDIVLRSYSSRKRSRPSTPRTVYPSPHRTPLSISPNASKTEYTSPCGTPLQLSPRVPLLNLNRSPPSKSPRVSLTKQMKVRSRDFSNNKKNGGYLLAACKDLVDLAVTRGSLDDITVMVVDLSRYCKV